MPLVSARHDYLALSSLAMGETLSRRAIEPLIQLTTAANALDLLVQRRVRGIALICNGLGRICRLSLRRRLGASAVSLTLRSSRPKTQRRCKQSDDGTCQQFLQIFPTVLSTLLFS
jgi:hypothetical protein